MQNPERLRFRGRILGTLAGFGAGLVVGLVLIWIITSVVMGDSTTGEETVNTFNTLTPVLAIIALVVGGFVYYRVRGHYDRLADIVERQMRNQAEKP
jgi:hypothetical protein